MRGRPCATSVLPPLPYESPFAIAVHVFVKFAKIEKSIGNPDGEEGEYTVFIFLTHVNVPS